MRRLTLLAGTLLALGLFVGSPQLAAHAATNWPATCATLQTVLSAPTTLAGDTVTLANAGVPCTTPTITYPVTLPSKQITLAGAAAGDGFNGQGSAQLLTGSDVGATVITNLTFENGSVAGFGAAISIGGNSNPTISNSTFLGNSALRAGAVYLTNGNLATTTITGNTFGGTGAGAGNSSTTGFAGGLLVDQTNDAVISHNSFVDNTSAGGNNGFGGAGGVFVIARSPGSTVTFTDNTVTGNSETTGGGIGGGATLEAHNFTVTNNSFVGNSIGAGSMGGPGNFGGGLDVVSIGSGPGTLSQSHNLFKNNHVGAYHDTSARSSDVYFGGGGEFAQTPTIHSFDDTFIGNSVDAGVGLSTGAGGGLAVEGEPSGNTTTVLTATNLVATNNTVQTAADGEGHGGGIYAGFDAGCAVTVCPAEVDLFDSTVTANSAHDGSGMSGGIASDVGKVTNSIVYGNAGDPAQVAFGNLTVTSSDSCSAPNTAYGGTGNLCADPKLVNAAGNDVHETSSSPTVNAGNNSLIPAGVSTDYSGVARILGGTVDMGAAEFQAATPITPPVPASGAVSGSALPAGLGLLTLGLALLAMLAGSMAVRRRRSAEL